MLSFPAIPSPFGFGEVVRGAIIKGTFYIPFATRWAQVRRVYDKNGSIVPVDIPNVSTHGALSVGVFHLLLEQPPDPRVGRSCVVTVDTHDVGDYWAGIEIDTDVGVVFQQLGVKVVLSKARTGRLLFADSPFEDGSTNISLMLRELRHDYDCLYGVPDTLSPYTTIVLSGSALETLTSGDAVGDFQEFLRTGGRLIIMASASSEQGELIKICPFSGASCNNRRDRRLSR